MYEALFLEQFAKKQRKKHVLLYYMNKLLFPKQLFDQWDFALPDEFFFFKHTYSFVYEFLWFSSRCRLTLWAKTSKHDSHCGLTSPFTSIKINQTFK